MWKDIPGYEGIYQASNLGRIRSAPWKATSNARFNNRVWNARILKPKKQVSGGRCDLRVDLWKEGGHKDHLVSRLVALTWCDGYTDGLTVNHIDGDYLNNRPENLEWVSLSENIRHGFKSGLYASIQKKVRLVDCNGGYGDFPSMASASRYLGRNSRYLSNAIAKKHTIRDVYGEPYKVLCSLPFYGGDSSAE